MIAFGPVPSRRLGRSLGINNIPPKVCTYSCVYCQVGRTIRMEVDRRPFYEPDEILRDVRERVEKAREQGERIDYLTFVPDGEPTLDVNLGHEIDLLRPLGIKIAVITNGSLLWQDGVREALMKADWVSLKIDAMWQDTWRRVDRPVRTLDLPKVVGGMREFTDAYRGELTAETMLVKGLNESASQADQVAYIAGKLRPARVYVSIPTRPPAEDWVEAPGEGAINRFYQILRKTVDRVEYLIGYEGNAFSSTGNVAEDMVSITAVHPMREDAVDELLTRANADWSVIHDLIARRKLVETQYEGHRFYMRRTRARRSA